METPQVKTFPQSGGSLEDEKKWRKITTLFTVFFFIAVVIYAILITTMYFAKWGFFKAYSRPPLPGQKGNAIPIGDATNGNVNPNTNVTPSDGIVALLGSVTPLTKQQQQLVNAKVANEKQWWETKAANTTPSNSDSSGKSSVSFNSGFVGLSPEITQELIAFHF